MDRLWAPWRLSYVTATPLPPTDCIFCDACGASDVELVLLRAQHSFVILNLYPYNNGHLMVVPNRHLSALEALTMDEQAELMRLTRWSEMALTEAYQPHGINVGINLGKAAGAGIENHLHIHLVPRWSGDTNFMTAVGETRVLPEQLGATATRLRPIFDRLTRA
ncbi:MAG TPA: HIT domain-containing protein [Vicinamibacterales bacterium]|nr:HIT domain-containing protein [Vicinamibacterales bacterium]